MYTPPSPSPTWCGASAYRQPVSIWSCAVRRFVCIPWPATLCRWRCPTPLSLLCSLSLFFSLPLPSSLFFSLALSVFYLACRRGCGLLTKCRSRRRRRRWRLVFLLLLLLLLFLYAQRSSLELCNCCHSRRHVHTQQQQEKRATTVGRRVLSNVKWFLGMKRTKNSK